MAARGGWGDGTLTAVSPGKWKLRLPPYLGRGQVTFHAPTLTAAKKEQRRLLTEAYQERFHPQAVVVPFNEWCDLFLSRHVADPHSTLKLKESLKSARKAFGDVRLDELTHDTISEWRAAESKRLAAATLHGYTAAVKQVLTAAVRSGVFKESPARHIPNPVPAAGIVNPFETVAEVLAVADEMPAAYKALPVLACMTGLRPEEWLALERADIRGGFIYVNKRYVRGQFKQGTKNGDPERRVPMSPMVAEWLDKQPPRLDTRLVFPAASGRFLVLNSFREDVWKPAIAASGAKPRRMKDMRHTYATWQLDGNCNLWHLSKHMGTAVQQIERTYGRWIPGSEEMALQAMDRFLERQTSTR